MKKYISYLLTLALLVPAFVSCTEELKDNSPRKSHKHTVYFSSVDQTTKTGLSIEDNMAVPDWKKADPQNVHFFEMDANKEAAYGVADIIELSENDRTAHFKAAIDEDVIIHIDDGSKGSTKGTRTGPFTYGAVVAQKPGEAYTFVIPSEQHPDAETLKDPDADFLIGYSRKSYDDPYDYDNLVVDLYFDRVAALGRISLSNFKGSGETVKSVTINADAGLTGSASASDIDFENSTVNFVRDEAPGILTLSYGDGVAAPALGAFEAYFVTIPGKVSITSIEVLTDQYHYTKTLSGGKEITFSADVFKNINLDLSTAEAEEAGPDSSTWYKASIFEDGCDYLIVSGGQALKNNSGSTDKVAVSPQDGVITFESDADPTIVWRADARTEMTGSGSSDVVAGHFTLTNNGYYLQRNSQDILLDTSIPSDKPKYVVWDYDGSYLRHESSGTMTFFCYYDSEWTTGYTQNGDAPGSSIGTVQIYTNRPPQEIAFSVDEITFDIDGGATFTEPELTTSATTVAYSSSNIAVASVNETTGKVEIKKVGTAVITAIAAGDDQHQAGSASYTILVTSSNVNIYNKVTSTADLEAGSQYLLVFEGLAGDADDGDPKVFKPILSSDGKTFSKSTSNALDVEISSNTITSSEFEDCHLTLEAGYYLKSDAEGSYLYPTGSSSGSGTLSAEATATNSLTIGFSDGIVQIKTQSGSNYLVWSTSSHYFSSNSSLSGQYSTGICLYVLDDGRQHQNPTFSETEFNYDIDGGAAFVKPTLSGAIGTVKYSSSNENIAEVNATTGDVTILKTGTVVITASAAGNTEYKPGSASYTIHVTSTNVPTWYKAEEIVAGDDYLIISNGYALQNNNGSSAGVAEEVFTGDSFQYDADDNLIWTAAASSSKFTFENNGQYLQRGGSSGRYTATASSSASGYYLWSYDYSTSYLTATGSGSSTYYLYYSTSNDRWSMSTTSGSSHVAVLYSSTPPLTPRNLTFSPASVTHDLAQGYNVEEPSLEGVTDGVSYSVTSGSSVASVNSTTGEVTLSGKTGTATITASAPKNDTYKAEEVSYTLTVKNSEAPVKTYRKVTSSSGLKADAKYLLVFESTPSVFKPILDGSTFKKAKDNVQSVTISSSKIESSELEDCELTLKDGYYFYVESADRYLYPYTESNNTSLQAESSPSHNLTVSIQSDGIAKITNASTTAASLCWSTNSSYFSSTYSTSVTINVCLYMLDDGSTPGGGDDPTPSTTQYVKVSSSSDLVAGDKYILVYEDGSKVFKPTLNGSNFATSGNALDVSISDGTITSDALEDCQMTLEDGYYLYVASVSRYLYPTYNNMGAEETKGSSHSFNISISSSGVATISRTSNNTTYNLRYSSSSSYFQSSSSSANVALYKRVED